MAGKKKNLTQEQVGLTYGFRSGLEETVAQQLDNAEKYYRYEELTLAFIQPEKNRTYTPDFEMMKCTGEPMIVETKGRFTLQDRQKMQWVKQQYPNLDIRLIFNNPNAKISKGAKTTYAMWCDKNGFKYAKKEIPKEWLDECL